MEGKKVPVGYHSGMDNLISRIEDVQEEQAHLTTALRASILIESIWSDAFKHGSVRFSGIQRHQRVPGQLGDRLAFFEAWFINAKFKRYLSAAELIRFKPDCFIGKQYDDHGCSWVEQ